MKTSYLLVLQSSLQIWNSSAWAPRPLPSTPTGTLTHLAMSSASTTQERRPRLDLPEPLRSSTPGTWAHDTMSRRVDGEILARTLEDNQEFLDLHPEIATAVEGLRHDLRTAAPLKYPTAPTSADQKEEFDTWCEILKPIVEKKETWLSAPWMVSEFYIYRSLMDCFGYWNKDSAGYMYDPFGKQKHAGLVSSTKSAEAILKRIPNLPATAKGQQVAFSMALWGNKMDLSLWPADAESNKDVFSEVLAAAHENMLHDDSETLSKWCDSLIAKGGGAVDIIVDNAGFELVTDLALGQYLIETGIAKTVTFQLKSHPTFVSDALEKDLRETVDYYTQLSEKEFPHARAAGLKWQSYLESGQWQCQEHPFWVQGWPMWRMTESLYQDLQKRCDLAIVKGDANYRRLLGDLDWDKTASFEDVVGAYFPCPVLALRTLKSEICCGMAQEQVERASELDDNWLVNGRFGVVHFSTAE
jgi:hypothetical protein